MERIKRRWKRIVEFDNETDYFWLSDSLCLLFEQRPPLTKWLSIKVLWAVLSLLHGFQYVSIGAATIRCVRKTPFNLKESTAFVNLFIVLTVAIFRGLCLAYYRDTVTELKQYLNSKSCLRDDGGAFELRRKAFLKVNKRLTVVYSMITFNSLTWVFTAGMNGNLVKIPIPMDGVPDALGKILHLFAVLVFIPWCYTVIYAPSQFIPILSIMRTECSIIVEQFSGIFEKTVSNYALEPQDLIELSQADKTRFWSELNTNFENALSYHASFVRNFQLLRKISDLNFFIFLCSSAVLITLNIYPIISESLYEDLPLLLLAMQYLAEIYLYCTMFENLELENNRITRHIYAFDWLNSIGTKIGNDKVHCKSIYLNALILHKQVQKGLAIRAGGIFPLNLKTFTGLIKSVYSLLTLLHHSMNK